MKRFLPPTFRNTWPAGTFLTSLAAPWECPFLLPPCKSFKRHITQHFCDRRELPGNCVQDPSTPFPHLQARNSTLANSPANSLASLASPRPPTSSWTLSEQSWPGTSPSPLAGTCLQSQCLFRCALSLELVAAPSFLSARTPFHSPINSITNVFC